MSASTEVQLKALEKRLTAVERKLESIEAKARSIGDVSKLDARISAIDKTVQALIGASTSKKELGELIGKLSAKIDKREEKLVAKAWSHESRTDSLLKSMEGDNDRKVQHLRATLDQALTREAEVYKAHAAKLQKDTEAELQKRHESDLRELADSMRKEAVAVSKAGLDEAEKIANRAVTMQVQAIQKSLIARITALEARVSR